MAPLASEPLLVPEKVAPGRAGMTWASALWIFAAALIVVVLVAAYFLTRGPDLSAYEKFRDPAMLTMGAERMLVVERKGAPDKVAGEAFGTLFKAYFKLDHVPKGPRMPAPRARWNGVLDTPADQWVGLYGLPVPQEAAGLLSPESGNVSSARFETWEYGEIAQILHVGRYDKETPTIQRLVSFIKDRGYMIIGAHEEEYLRGPGTFGRGDPNGYYTLIRYRVAKARGNPGTEPRGSKERDR